MIKTFFVVVIFLLGALIACGIKSKPEEKPLTSEEVLTESQVAGKESWQVEWEKTLQAAKIEGSVTVDSSRGGEFREVVMREFKKKYGIDVELTTAGTRVIVKIAAERMAGLHLYDVLIEGGSTAFILKNKGFLGKMEPMLILPEVKDTKYWKDSPSLWNDEEGYIIMPGVRPHHGVMYNTNLVGRGELKSYFDLLKPKFKGKIGVFDPTYMGSGQGTFAKVKVIIDEAGKDGEYFWRQIAKQEPFIAKSNIILLQWLMRGKLFVNFGKGEEDFIYAVKGGAPVDAFMPEEGTWLGSSGRLVVMDKPSHPNAAKVFINWYLSKEGQEITQPHLAAESLRVDVLPDYLEPWLRSKPGAKYIDLTGPEWEDVRRPALLPLAQEIFGPLLR